ncbi:MAG: N-methyl-D-aspartate receptor NMDAR2C subunit [Candidatus Thiodiazotropha sp.]
MDIQSLKERWLSLNILKEAPFLDEEFSAIHEKYSEPHRHYHTIEHIKSCLESFDLIKGDLKNPEIVELALWLHDVIYDPKKNNNEEMSARFAKDLLNRVGSDSTNSYSTNELIKATKHPSTPTSHDQKYIIDIDLSILGAAPEIYDKYSSQIRREYSHIPSFLYKKGRRKVLESFLSQNTIFHTEHFFSTFENLARNNLEREIVGFKS